MNKKSLFIIITLVLLMGLGGYSYKKAKDSESDMPEITFLESDLNIQNPYAFATIAQAKTAAAFMVIQNPNSESEKLIEAWSNIAEFTEVHENIIDPDDGTMMMRKIKALEIPQKGQALLKPKGYHIMFINLKKQLNIGDSFPLTLVFENNGEQIVTVNVIAPGTTPTP